MKTLSALIDSDVMPDRSHLAKGFCAEHGFEVFNQLDDIDSGLVLHFSKLDVSLLAKNFKRTQVLRVDFLNGALAHRRKFGGGKGQAIAKAVGLSSKFRPEILDATAGLGRDAFVLASLGATLTMLERSPVVNLLLADGLERARSSGDSDLMAIVNRMSLRQEDSAEYLQKSDTLFDVVYLDPMFPARKKSADVKKEMKIFHELIGQDQDADELLDLALARAEYRVVVKRPRHAPFLADRAPNYSLEGKSSRFDIFACKAVPK